MQLTADLHTHSEYSDAHCTIDEQVARARELGLGCIALTDHGFSHLVFGLKRKEREEYFAEIRAAEKRHGVRVLAGIEENILGRKGTCALTAEDLALFDIVLCGFHVMSTHESMRDWLNGWKGYLGYNIGLSLGGRLKREQTTAYINTVKNNPIDVLTHVGFQCFCDPLEVAKACADFGTYFEISGKKSHVSDEELAEIVAKTEVRFVVDSDAHSPQRLGDIAIAEAQIARVGVPLARIDNIDGKMPRLRSAEHKRQL